MKKIFSAFIAAVAAILMVSCEEQGPQTITVSVNVDETGIEGLTLPESYEIALTNFNTAEVKTANTENGVAVFADILPGVYKVTATAGVTEGGFAYTLTGVEEKAEFLEEGDALALKIAAAKESALIFKEIYYAGAPGDSYYFRDQFYEIYNNSDQTVYADGLCLAETFFANFDFSIIYEYEVPGKDAKDYVFAQKIWQIPGNGTQYPIQPGESFIIAQWATNHTDESLSKGLSVMNLKGAEFETFCGESTTWNGITLTDEQAINMNFAVNTTGYNTPQWLTSVSGSRYIIFKPSTPLREGDFLAPVKGEDSMANVHEILITDVIDAVEAISDETRLATLGLPAVLDAGAIWCSKSYSGESISRKIKEKKEDGRIVYQDTNNTTDDFVVNKVPQARRNNAGVPSWNTWYK